jgi:hypothetical protein
LVAQALDFSPPQNRRAWVPVSRLCLFILSVFFLLSLSSLHLVGSIIMQTTIFLGKSYNQNPTDFKRKKAKVAST